jgi:N-acetylmuramoyl-L-alanine amidase
MRIAVRSSVICLVLCLVGCVTSPDRSASTRPVDPVLANIDEAWALLASRPDWTVHPAMNLARHPAEKYLAGLVIVLDPGHGASDGKTDPTYKRGPTGVMEDHMNLRTALLLRKLLVDAGATVLMTRETDALVTHQERADVANNYRGEDGRGADLFISVHHNYSDNPQSNYTSVWYHGEVDWNGMELDVGRYVAHALGRHLRTDVAKTSPLLSDQLMYKSGFAMLRLTKVPAILCEISFYSNPEEEKRLADATYNLRAAYAIYEGLCEWAYCGRPRVTQLGSILRTGLTSRPATDDEDTVSFFAELSDGLPAWWGKDRNRIESSSVYVAVDGAKVESTFDPTTKRVSFALRKAQLRGIKPATVTIRFTNMLGNHNEPFTATLGDGEGNGFGTKVPTLTRAVGDVQAPVTRPATQPAVTR